GLVRRHRKLGDGPRLRPEGPRRRAPAGTPGVPLLPRRLPGGPRGRGRAPRAARLPREAAGGNRLPALPRSGRTPRAGGPARPAGPGTGRHRQPRPAAAAPARRGLRLLPSPARGGPARPTSLRARRLLLPSGRAPRGLPRADGRRGGGPETGWALRDQPPPVSAASEPLLPEGRGRPGLPDLPRSPPARAPRREGGPLPVRLTGRPP